MIDKKIFYCWFGQGEMSDLNKKCINSWKKYCPDYEIIEINETNFDYNITPYAKEAYEHGNWSYVSNAARLEFLKHNNGFYLDTDVQLVKSLDDLRQYDNGFITEFEPGQPDSGVLGRGNTFPWLYQIAYDELVPGSILHKNFIRNMYQKYDIHGESIKTYDDGFVILGEEWFPTVRTHLITKNTIGIHHFENTWIKQWKRITDGFYPFPKVKAYIYDKLLHEDKNPEMILTLKNYTKKWSEEGIIGTTNYFFNPKVVKLECKDFVAERIEYDKNANISMTICPGGLLVYWMDV